MYAQRRMRRLRYIDEWKVSEKPSVWPVVGVAVVWGALVLYSLFIF